MDGKMIKEKTIYLITVNDWGNEVHYINSVTDDPDAAKMLKEIHDSTPRVERSTDMLADVEEFKVESLEEVKEKYKAWMKKNPETKSV